MDITQINLWAVLAAAVSSFLVGGLWYSPVLFGKAWMQAAGLSEAQLARANQARTFGLSLLLCLLSASVFAVFLGPAPELGFAVGVGVLAGACWVASSFAINYLFEQRSMKLFAINGGYHTVQFALYGLILGAWQ
ncbi:MAG: membrane protein [Lysobacteraceae bacterium]|nr:MAG: membrane protein [Xanthomonadaceae bacterium]